MQGMTISDLMRALSIFPLHTEVRIQSDKNELISLSITSVTEREFHNHEDEHSVSVIVLGGK